MNFRSTSPTNASNHTGAIAMTFRGLKIGLAARCAGDRFARVAKAWR
jgi:hypothetical protein